jgi:hypothetical protein
VFLLQNRWPLGRPLQRGEFGCLRGGQDRIEQTDTVLSARDSSQHRAVEAAAVDHDDRAAGRAADDLLAGLMGALDLVVETAVVERLTQRFFESALGQQFPDFVGGQFVLPHLDPGTECVVEPGERILAMLVDGRGEEAPQPPRAFHHAFLPFVEVFAVVQNCQVHLPQGDRRVRFAPGIEQPSRRDPRKRAHWIEINSDLSGEFSRLPVRTRGELERGTGVLPEWG